MLPKRPEGNLLPESLSRIGQKILHCRPLLLEHSGVHPDLEAERDRGSTAPIEGGLLGRHDPETNVRRFHYQAHQDGYALKLLAALHELEPRGETQRTQTRESLPGGLLNTGDAAEEERELTIGGRKYRVVIRGCVDKTAKGKKTENLRKKLPGDVDSSAEEKIGKTLAKPPTRPHGMVPSEEERVRAGQMSVLIYALTGKTPALIVSTPIAEVRALQIPVREFKSLSLQMRHDPQVLTDEDFLNMVHLLFKARYVLKDLEK